MTDKRDSRENRLLEEKGNEIVSDADSIVIEVCLDEEIVKRVFRTPVYEDQTIPARSLRDEATAPETVEETRRERPEPERWFPDYWLFNPIRTKQLLFRREAERYADRESDAVFTGSFLCYYPTYRDLPKPALEGYFGWRTRARRGEYGPAPTSFLFLHVYELLALVGVSSAAEGLQRLGSLAAHYQIPSLHSYLQGWTRDFVIYYQLTDHWEEVLAELRREDRTREILRRPERFEPAEIRAAMEAVSGYDLSRSAFLRNHPEVCDEAMSRVYLAVCEDRKKRGNPRFPERFSGLRGSWRYEMFRNALFSEPEDCPDCRIEVDPVRAYVRKDRLWKVHGLGCNRPLARNPLMTALMRETDRSLRELFGEGRPLKEADLEPDLAAVVWEAAARYDRDRRAAAKPKLTLHRELLAGIRTDAADTMSRLLVGEEEDPLPAIEDRDFAGAGPKPPIDAQTAPKQPEPAPAGLGAEEAEFLRLVLAGGDWKGYCAANMLLPSILADAVNEKLLDEIGDTVLEETDGGYAVIEDYLDDVKGLLGQEE